MSNSRVQEILNRIELVAKKLEMSIEDAVSILEGRHPTHTVVQKYKEVESNNTENPTASGATSSSPTPSTLTASAATPTPAAPSAVTLAANSNPPTTSGPADASAGASGQQAAGSIASGGEAEIAAQNQAATGAVLPPIKDIED